MPHSAISFWNTYYVHVKKSFPHGCQHLFPIFVICFPGTHCSLKCLETFLLLSLPNSHHFHSHLQCFLSVSFHPYSLWDWYAFVHFSVFSWFLLKGLASIWDNHEGFLLLLFLPLRKEFIIQLGILWFNSISLHSEHEVLSPRTLRKHFCCLHQVHTVSASLTFSLFSTIL